ncbi:platelet glycoprotein Ib alpha chain-like [Eriocheir sinensis]|uniref:platelet glycoprotein Ib alpha chain-like n=1 Tax=Eriocheir sinensis TaxID=95602 RepID=UPI0021C6870B|nr:platelet glycoprotein Ib alpha chain-like [Eriocheir sinensis]
MMGRLSRLLPRGHVFLFLLVVVVALSQGTRRCREADVVLGEGEVQRIAGGTRDNDAYYYKTVYLWPEEGFLGVGLQALVDTRNGTTVRLAAWFSKDSLFTAANTTAWWKLWVRVHDRHRVMFAARLGDSVKDCYSWVTADKLQGLDVVGYGPSRWRHTKPPPECPYQDTTAASWPRNPPTCTAPPPITRATTPAPITRATTPAPITRATTPAPITRATTPAPITRATTPAPITRATTPAPDPLLVAAVTAVLVALVTAVAATLIAADLFRTQQRRGADQNAA